MLKEIIISTEEVEFWEEQTEEILELQYLSSSLLLLPMQLCYYYDDDEAKKFLVVVDFDFDFVDFSEKKKKILQRMMKEASLFEQ